MKKPKAEINEVRSIVEHSGTEIVELEVWLKHRMGPWLLFRTVGHATPGIRRTVEGIVGFLNAAK